jgi:hypothetical protein
MMAWTWMGTMKMRRSQRRMKRRLWQWQRRTLQQRRR